MILELNRITQLVEQIYSPAFVKDRQDDYDRWLIYNGKIQPIVEKAIRKEFKNPDTINELISRIIPINITRKVVQKLGNVYLESPKRESKEMDEIDNDSLGELVDAMCLDSTQKESNRYFKLFKKNLQEIYLDEQGVPMVRNLPRHTYEVFSHSPTSPHVPDTICKIIQMGNDRSEHKLIWWTDESHLITNGYGQVDATAMASMENLEGLNPFGVLPFVFYNESSFDVRGISNDDLKSTTIAISLMLSDLAMAIKYLSWSVIYTVGAGGSDIPFSPNSIVHLEHGINGEKPEIGTVTPQVNINETLRYVEFLIATLLSTNNLSTNAVSGQLNSSNIASGVSKMLDAAESIEDKKDQHAFFRKGEVELFDKLTQHLIPHWQKTNSLSDRIPTNFSQDFALSITFKEPKAMVTEKEKVELAKAKLDSGLITKERALAELNQDMRPEQIKKLLFEIEGDKSREDLAKVSSLISEGTDQHFHEGTGFALPTLDGEHYHVMIDGSGITDQAPSGPGHRHAMPAGGKTGGPVNVGNFENVESGNDEKEVEGLQS